MERLQLQIERFIRSGHGTFEELSLDLFGYQYEFNRPYQAFCRASGVTPSNVRRWEDIPAVPVHAFKSAELATFPVAHAAAAFHSSTTSGQAPSKHYLKSLTPYELALKASFKAAFLPDNAGLPFLILTPSPGESPRSSLVWMMDVVRREWGQDPSQYFVQRGLLNEPPLARTLKKLQDCSRPVALLGTTLAFLAFFDYLTKEGLRFSLPAGSRLMDTGGMKGTQREITRDAFVSLVQEKLGIGEAWCINEYGMAELGSQFYGRGRSTFLEGPAWCRTLVINPVSGQPVKEGEEGLLRYVDLVNVDSVAAIQTDDLGRAEGKGFHLLGRAKGAEVRGCSLSAEQFARTIA